MAWTQANVDELEAAILALSTGAQEVKYGDRMVKYAELPQLLALRATMIRAVAGKRKSCVQLAIQRYK